MSYVPYPMAKKDHDQPKLPDVLRQTPVVRAYPENTEVLTEHGFYKFEDLNNFDMFEGEVAHTGRGMPQSFRVKLDYTLYKPNDSFPRIASVHPRTGEVEYVRATMFRTFQYTDWLAHLKMRGVDLFTTRYADLWLRGLYGRDFGFVLADNVSRNKAPKSLYHMVDKFNQDLYGEYQPKSGLKAFLDKPIALRPLKHSGWKRIENEYQYVERDSMGRKVVADRVKTVVDAYNVDVEKYHTIIVRRGRKDNGNRTPWTGNPVVAGDGSDKSISRVDSILDLVRKNNTTEEPRGGRKK